LTCKEGDGFIEALAARIRDIGFSCTRCGECCRAGPGDGNLVMVSPSEVCRIARFSGKSPKDIAEPYPESVILPDHREVTFGRALRRVCGDCLFYTRSSCEVYPARPAICRTYPFMLEGNNLRVFPCKGIGLPISLQDSLALARDLVVRREEEDKEVEGVRQLFPAIPTVPGRFLIDSEGVTRL